MIELHPNVTKALPLALGPQKGKDLCNRQRISDAFAVVIDSSHPKFKAVQGAAKKKGMTVEDYVSDVTSRLKAEHDKLNDALTKVIAKHHPDIDPHLIIDGWRCECDGCVNESHVPSVWTPTIDPVDLVNEAMQSFITDAFKARLNNDMATFRQLGANLAMALWNADSDGVKLKVTRA